ncbi:Ubiquitin carboxyl-terminal hydrolase 19 [Chamberlinius hualienensis]
MGGANQEMNFSMELRDVETAIHEKDNGCFVLSLSVKDVDAGSVGVNVSKDGVLSLIFKTKDRKILSCHPGSTEETAFIWHYTLQEKVQENYTFTVQSSSLSIHLERQEPYSVVNGALHNHLPVLNAKSKLSDSLKVINEKKPTCLVNPITNCKLGNGELGSNKGFTGLQNLGNTCYMNSVLQSLVNTREFRDYFLESHFETDINKDNPLGTGGELANTFANVCKKLWDSRFKSVDASLLKDVISRRSKQFQGYAQHDAQELMAFLVDGLHEDLNRVKNMPKAAECESKDEKEVAAADSSWLSYKRRNDSTIVDLFQGQYKSKLVCPDCNKISITFDPFLYLSVPLPKKIRLIPVVFFFLDYARRPVKYYAKLSQTAKVEDLKEILSKEFDVSLAKISVFEVYRNKIHRYIGKGQTMESIEPNDTIFAFETCIEHGVEKSEVEVAVVQRLLMPSPPKRCAFCTRERPTIGDKLKRCTKCYRVSYCDEMCQKNHWHVHRANCKVIPELVGSPFLITLPKSECTYSKLYQIMEGYSRYSVNTFKPPLDVNSSSSSSSSSDQTAVKSEVQTSVEDVVNDVTMNNDLTATTTTTTKPEQPLFYICPVNQSGITLPAPKGKRLEDKKDEIMDLSSTPHLAMDWRNNDRMSNHVYVETKPLDAESFQSESERRDAVNNTTLDQCLNLFCAPETLSQEEAWFCSNCQKNRQATKQMSIRRAPQILIIQLKRFLFKNSIFWREKIDKMVKYPIRGLDLSPYCCTPVAGEEPEPSTVIRFIRYSNATEIGWRLFDDAHVSHLPESEVVSRYAYVLFYRRRNSLSVLYKTPSSTAPAALGSARSAFLISKKHKNDLIPDSDDDEDEEEEINS